MLPKKSKLLLVCVGAVTGVVKPPKFKSQRLSVFGAAAGFTGVTLAKSPKGSDVAVEIAPGAEFQSTLKNSLIEKGELPT